MNLNSPHSGHKYKLRILNCTDAKLMKCSQVKLEISTLKIGLTAFTTFIKLIKWSTIFCYILNIQWNPLLIHCLDLAESLPWLKMRFPGNSIWCHCGWSDSEEVMLEAPCTKYTQHDTGQMFGCLACKLLFPHRGNEFKQISPLSNGFFFSCSADSTCEI